MPRMERFKSDGFALENQIAVDHIRILPDRNQEWT